MRLFWRGSKCVASACGLLLACCAVQAQTRATAATPPTLPMASSSSVSSSSSPSSIKRLVHKKPHHRTVAKRKRGQQKIDSDRAREIQEALIHEHYLDGEPTGKWDVASEKAMERFQADNGWQTTVIPDSRALIKLGLGPDHEHLLNPETAMTSRAEPIRPESTSSAPAADPGPAPSSMPASVSSTSTEAPSNSHSAAASSPSPDSSGDVAPGDDPSPEHPQD